MDVRKAIREAAKNDPHGNPEDIAKEIAQRATKQDLAYLLIEEIQSLQRAHTRYAEHSVFTAAFQRNVETPRQLDVTAFAKLFTERFRLGDGTEVEWGKATVAQHAARIALLKQMRDGINATIERHEEAVRVIQASGASCLEDIGGADEEAA